MKIEQLELDGEFRPIRLSITIETLAEYNALYGMTSLNETIPETVEREYDDVKGITIRTFLDSFRLAMVRARGKVQIPEEIKT